MGCIGSNLVLEGVEIDLDKGPTEADCELHGKIAIVLKECDGILLKLRNYKSCAEPCRKALSDATAENRYLALESVTQVALQVFDYYSHGKAIADSVSAIMRRLIENISSAKTNPTNDIQFSEHSALIMQLCQIFSFVIQFDNLKTENSSIQNDLSMYRRMCQISKKSITELVSNSAGEGMEAKEFEKKLIDWTRPEELDPDSVSSMSFFIASPIPLTAQTVTELLDLAANDPRIDYVLPHIANLFLVLVQERRFGVSSEKYKSCIEAMTCAMIICDRVEPEGVFHSRSPVQVGDAITLLKKYPLMFPDQPDNDTDHLVSGLRYWTIHLQDATTPNRITKKLDVA